MMVLGLFNRRIRDSVDAEVVRPNIIGVLPELPENVTDPAEAMLATQCMHQIRTLLQAHTIGQKSTAMAITSAASGTGKSSVTLSLGLSFACVGIRTLVIDGDVVGRSLTRRTGADCRLKLGHVFRRYSIVSDEELAKAERLARESGAPIGETLLGLGYINEVDLKEGLAIQNDLRLGLVDAINGENLSDCIVDVGVPNLSILPAGDSRGIHVNGMSLSSTRALIDKAKGSYEIILIDTGPIPGPSDSSVMASSADGVLLVVSRGDNQAEVNRALQHLELIRSQVFGLVFNRATNRDMQRSSCSSSASSYRGEYANTSDANGAGELIEVPHKWGQIGPLAQAVWSTAFSAPTIREFQNAHFGSQGGEG